MKYIITFVLSFFLFTTAAFAEEYNGDTYITNVTNVENTFVETGRGLAGVGASGQHHFDQNYKGFQASISGYYHDDKESNRNYDAYSVAAAKTVFDVLVAVSASHEPGSYGQADSNSYGVSLGFRF